METDEIKLVNYLLSNTDVLLIRNTYFVCITLWDLVEWLERLTANAQVATVLGSIPASSDTLESKGRQMKQCWIKYLWNTYH